MDKAELQSRADAWLSVAIMLDKAASTDFRDINQWCNQAARQADARRAECLAIANPPEKGSGESA